MTMKTKSRPRVYIAGPLSHGDLQTNIKQATDAARLLLKAGLAPLCPHLSCYLDGPTPNVHAGDVPAETWYEVDLPWVAVSQALLRLPGYSVGADKEVNAAHALNIPVYHCVQTLIEEKDGLGTENGHAGFLAILNEMRSLHQKKGSDYGYGTDPLANLRSSSEFGLEPWRATVIRLNDKMSRIKSFCTNGKLSNESFEDALIDAANYAALALALYRETKTARLPTVPTLVDMMGDPH